MEKSQVWISCTGFSVDLFRTVIPKSHFSSFGEKKLPLEALSDSGLHGLNFEPFCQNGRLGPPESERGLGTGCRK